MYIAARPFLIAPERDAMINSPVVDIRQHIAPRWGATVKRAGSYKHDPPNGGLGIENGQTPNTPQG